MTANDALRLRDEFAGYARSYSLLHESTDNELIEYRRIFPPDRAATFLESRVLRSDGTAYPDSPDEGPWYLVDDAHFVALSYTAPDLLRELCDL